MDAIYLTALSHTVSLTVLLVVIPTIIYIRNDFASKGLWPRTLMIGVPALAILVLWLGMPDREAMRARYRLAFRAKSEDVQQLCLLPEHSGDSPQIGLNLIQNRHCEVSGKLQDRVIESLHSARPFMPKRHGIKWSCRLEIQSDEGRVTFLVNRTHADDNGTLVYIQGGLTGRTCYRCDRLGEVLEDVARAAPHSVGVSPRILSRQEK